MLSTNIKQEINHPQKRNQICGDGTYGTMKYDPCVVKIGIVVSIPHSLTHLTVWTLSGSVSVSEEAGVAGRELELSPDTSVPVAYAVVRLLAELLRPPP